MTLDVSALYTNIPQEEGIEAVREMIKRHRHVVRGDLHVRTITTLLKMVLQMNNFKFNGQHYIQVGRTAMGTRVAPTFANIFMAEFERLHVYPYPRQPSLWLRFIDDIFMIWDHGQECLTEFINHLNQAHPTISFTVDISPLEVHFLHVWVINRNSVLHTDLYIKPTDSNMILHFDSAHPRHCRSGIPFGQYLRRRRICTDVRVFLHRALVKAKQFMDRGYPKSLLLSELVRATRRDRDDLLRDTDHSQTVTQTNQQVLVTTFHPSFKGLRPIVQGNWDTLSSSHKTLYLADRRLVAGLRRQTSIKDTLVRSKTDYHPQDPTPQNGAQPRTYNICTTNNCRYCARLDTEGRITSKTTGRSYMTKKNVSCKSSNIIYCIECKSCGHQYVGQTERKLMMRMCEHFGKITHARLHTDMGKHFCTPPHKGLDDVRIYILDVIPCHPQSKAAETLRDRLEFKWIHNLRCIAPLGLNLRDTPRFRKRRDTV